MTLKRILNIAALAALLVTASSCNTVDDERIPSMPVGINLSTIDLWTSYGVSGYGMYRTFVRELHEPRDFAYSATTATGFGGVLLVSGVNPFTLEAGVPLAYDLACPVEVKRDVRVRMQADDLVPVAVCPECGSSFDVVERAGAASGGPALSRKLGLRRYECLESAGGGYVITNSY